MGRNQIHSWPFGTTSEVRGPRARGQGLQRHVSPGEKGPATTCSPLQVHCPGWELACAGAKSEVLAPWSRWFITKFLQDRHFVSSVSRGRTRKLRGGSDSNLYSVTRTRLPWVFSCAVLDLPRVGVATTPSDLISVPLGDPASSPEQGEGQTQEGSLSVVRQCLLRGDHR